MCGYAKQPEKLVSKEAKRCAVWKRRVGIMNKMKVF